jgi:hypothetical protein
MVLVVVGVVMIGVMASCSVSQGEIGPGINTQVQLSQANFNVVKSIKGEASVNHFFGISFADQNLYGQAKADMLKKAGGLTGSQALVNITVDVKRTGIFIWGQKTIFMSAEVVEFK